MYILKPVASSCGRGIRVIGKKTHISKKIGYLASKYDLRLYVLVTSFEPLRVYLFEEGLVRLATQPYSTKGTLGKRFVHLTNYSVNKKSEIYVKNTNGQKVEEQKEQMPSKWDFKALKAEYE